MHDHDVDLILSLAEGGLSDEEAKAAETELAACPECSVELAAQRAALAALHAAPRVEMTAAERDLLHRELRRELRLEEEPRAAPPAGRRARWLAPLAGLATAAALVLAFVVVLPRNGDEAVPVAATAAPEQLGAQEPAPSEDVAGDPHAAAGEPPTLEAEQTATTTATVQDADSPVFAAALADDETELFHLGPEDTVDVAAFGTALPSLEELATHLDGSEPIYHLASKARTLAPATEELDYVTLNRCTSVGLEFFPDEDAQVYSSTVATGDLDGQEVLVVTYAIGSPSEDGSLEEPSSEVLVTLDPETCDVIDTFSGGP